MAASDSDTTEVVGSPQPPAKGWTLSEVAALWFPELWAVAEHLALTPTVKVKINAAVLSVSFRRRMELGDMVAFAIDTGASLDTPPKAIPAHAWAVCRPVFKYEHTTATPAESVTNLPGGQILQGARVHEAPSIAAATDGVPAALRAEIWITGYLQHAREVGQKVKRDDTQMRMACKQATRCTVDEVRRAYAAAPQELKTFDPNRRNRKA